MIQVVICAEVIYLWQPKGKMPRHPEVESASQRQRKIVIRCGRRGDRSRHAGDGGRIQAGTDVANKYMHEGRNSRFCPVRKHRPNQERITRSLGKPSEVVVSVARDGHAIASANVGCEADPTVEIVLTLRVPTSEVGRGSEWNIHFAQSEVQVPAR